MSTDLSPPPISAIRPCGDLLFVSGQIGVNPVTGKLAGDVASQTAQAIENLQDILGHAGRGLDDVVRVGIYLVDMDDYAAMNQVYARLFQPPYPARTAVGVASLPLGAAIEIDAVAGTST